MTISQQQRKRNRIKFKKELIQPKMTKRELIMWGRKYKRYVASVVARSVMNRRMSQSLDLVDFYMFHCDLESEKIRRCYT